LSLIEEKMADLDYEGFWNETLIQLRTNLGEEEFCGWFTDIKYLRAHADENAGENRVLLGIPSKFHQNKLTGQYLSSINSILTNLSGQKTSVQFDVIGKNAKKEASAQSTEQPIPSPAASETQKTKKKRDKHPNMQDDFTFESYVIGDNNAFAANAAIAISKNPGKAYNPFLIYGGSGLGKTHLMQAIGNSIHDNSDNEVIYTTSENFLNEFTTAILDNKTNQFKNKFRDTDVLLIDDIQFFQGKEKVQEELFHTFNALMNAKKQLVFTCDRPPSELKKFDERLRSRVGSLAFDLQPPRYEERCAILLKTAESKNVEIPNEVIDLVSKNISSNVRDLIAALNILIMYTELMKRPITVEIAQEKLKNIFYAPKQANLSIDIIIRVVSEHFGLTPNDIKGKKRSQNIVFARQLAMYIGREMTDYSTTELGQDFGGKDHTTVMHSIDKIKGKLIADNTLQSTIDSIKMSIKEFSAKH
jgi:chromosomal replication initiator protein